MIARTDTPLPVPVGYSVEFDVEHAVASKKNGRRPWKRGNRVFFIPSAKAVSDEKMVADAAREAISNGGMPFGPDDALSLDFTHDIDTDRITVRVEKVGELPTKGKRGTKRDVHGMTETIADALQGVLYPNDNQIDRFGGMRWRK